MTKRREGREIFFIFNFSSFFCNKNFFVINRSQFIGVSLYDIFLCRIRTINIFSCSHHREISSSFSFNPLIQSILMVVEINASETQQTFRSHFLLVTKFLCWCFHINFYELSTLVNVTDLKAGKSYKMRISIFQRRQISLVSLPQQLSLINIKHYKTTLNKINLSRRKFYCLAISHYDSMFMGWNFHVEKKNIIFRL